MKKQIRVFPDYISSGLWGPNAGDCEIDPDEINHVVPEHLLVALYYWNCVWEWVISTTSDGRRASKTFCNKWQADGKTIVDAMNACQDEIEFIYIGDMNEK